MISGIQHLSFCERQWVLIHLEQKWSENRFTAEGRNLHEKVHREDTESRRTKKIARGLTVCSFKLGLIGQTDVVEFHSVSPEDKNQNQKPNSGMPLPGKKGLWQPIPVEFKRGKPKMEPCDEIQLCAQALCLEEMLDVLVAFGILYYGQPKRRFEVRFDEELRRQTRRMAERMHELFSARQPTVGRFDKKCRSCSLQAECLPKVMRKGRSVWDYLAAQCTQTETP